ITKRIVLLSILRAQLFSSRLRVPRFPSAVLLTPHLVPSPLSAATAIAGAQPLATTERAPHPQRDRGGIAPLGGARQGQHRLCAAVLIDGIGRVPRVSPGGACSVRRGRPVERVAEAVREIQLAGVYDGSPNVHLDVDVHRAAGIPAGVDSLEGTCAAGI